jgi:hypothetical protein
VQPVLLRELSTKCAAGNTSRYRVVSYWISLRYVGESLASFLSVSRPIIFAEPTKAPLERIVKSPPVLRFSRSHER